MKTALAFMKPALGFVWPARTFPLYKTETAESAVLDLAAFRGRFQPYLEEFVAAKTRSYGHYSEAPLLRELWDYPRRLAGARGKRVRPYASFLMYSGLGGRHEEKALRLLTSLELFHLFCLVHDDIIDNGQERHGLPTVQNGIATRLRDEGRPADADRIGRAQALLLGDMLFAWAQEAFHSNYDFDAAAKSAAWRYFARMIDEVVIGEMLDVDMMNCEATTFAAIQQKMLLKTASYTFIRPLQIGAALAGRGVQCEKWCHDFGLAVGIAFQIQDDLLDLTGTPQTTHKTLFADLREGQHTYFTQYIFECGTPSQQTQLKQLMGADLGVLDRERVLDLFEASGAFAQGRIDIARHTEQAYRLLKKSPLPRAHRSTFEALLASMQNRSS